MNDAVDYVCIVRLDGIDRFLLWEDDDSTTRVVIDVDGFAIAFPSEAAARAVAQRRISPEEASRYDLDAIEVWCRSDADDGDYSQLLNAWNLFIDLPEGENLFRAADARARSVYDKLFRSCNLPSMALPGEHFVPTWTASELASLKHLLLLGLAELRARLR